PLAERWDGTSWSLQQAPAPAGSQGAFLAGVSCPSATSCTAVGGYQANSVPRTLAEAWDGSSWSVQPTANPAGADESALSAVICRSAGACSAVGYRIQHVGNLGGEKIQTLAEAEPQRGKGAAGLACADGADHREHEGGYGGDAVAGVVGHRRAPVTGCP